VPNALTMSRVVLAAAFFWLLSTTRLSPVPADAAWDERAAAATGANVWMLVAAAVFVVAAATDALDGMLARRWKVVSRFGRVMDPFADKLLVLGAFVFLAAPMFLVGEGATAFQASRVTAWMVVVILARELLVTSLRGVLESAGVDFSATLSGKLKMILQSVAAPVILVVLAFATPWPGTAVRALLDVIVYTTVFVSAISGVPYVTRAWRSFRVKG
jgi:CDP-diacylglycerol---glycerol-3-phosphate 3-phosphatidyltransferase